MEITELGRYVLLKELRVRGTNWVATLSAGYHIMVTQIDKEGRKFYSPDIGDWHPNWFPDDVIEAYTGGGIQLSMIEKCPICNAEMKLDYIYGSEHGTEEYKESCSGCGKTVKIFEYGFTELNIGFFSVGFGHSILDSERMMIKNVIDKVCEEYRNLRQIEHGVIEDA